MQPRYIFTVWEAFTAINCESRAKIKALILGWQKNVKQRNKNTVIIHLYSHRFRCECVLNLSCTGWPLTCQCPVAAGKRPAAVVQDVGVVAWTFGGAELQKRAQFSQEGVQTQTGGVVTAERLDQMVRKESLNGVQGGRGLALLDLPRSQQHRLAIRTVVETRETDGKWRRMEYLDLLWVHRPKKETINQEVNT